MRPPARPADRYEPLPGLFGLPRHFLRKLSPRGRKVAGAIGLLLLAAGIATAIVLTPRINEAKREHAAAERRARVQAAARERARLIAEQRPRHGTLAAAGDAALVAGVERAITRDATARAGTGEFPNPARRTDCRTLGRAGGRLVLACTAVTSDVQQTENASGLLIGYPYRAAVSTRSGRYALCKTSGRPGEGLYTRKLAVELPRACGG